MTDIKELALKFGGGIIDELGDNTLFTFTPGQLQSLLAEHLLLSSSEPFCYINPMFLTRNCIGGEFAFFKPSDLCIPLYLANPLNTQLLDSHRRLEEALIAAVLGIEFVSEKMNLDLHFVVALKEALLAIPESVKESK
jgi:hypothetical protein